MQKNEFDKDDQARLAEYLIKECKANFMIVIKIQIIFLHYIMKVQKQQMVSNCMCLLLIRNIL